ncbi:MAG TPA: hypothetical protein VJU81_25485 [Methylomirabilota bacterium]|nr:hypothetical protein [Methylomirabilota bacterium]
MREVLALFAALLIGGGLAPSGAEAQKDCPAEVAQAQSALKNAKTAAKGTQGGGPQDIQAPRSQAGARTQDVNAPRSQGVNAPRTQDVNAPRTQDVNAPRTQDVNAPRTQDVNAPRTQEGPKVREQDIDAPRMKQADTLVSQAQAACKKGDMTTASAKAKQALAILKK